MTRKLWAGLDVGVETTSLCVINDSGEVLQEATCPTTLNSIHRELRWLKRRRFARVGIETNGVTVARGLRSLGYSVDIYETRQLSRFLRVRRNKTDAGDAIGIAEAGRLGASLLSKVHMKSLECQSLQTKLTIRRYLVRQRMAAVNLLCRQIELYGGRIRASRTQLREKVELELKKLFGNAHSPLTLDLLHLLDHCEQLIAREWQLDRELTCLSLENEVCRRFMEIPGVGPICALTFYSAVGEPNRFRSSKVIGSYFGLTPKLFQSGLSLRLGRISRMGNRAARSLLVHSSMMIMRSNGSDCLLRDWASQIERRRGRGKARTALARKLAVIMLAMWKSGEAFKPMHALSS